MSTGATTSHDPAALRPRIAQIVVLSVRLYGRRLPVFAALYILFSWGPGVGIRYLYAQAAQVTMVWAAIGAQAAYAILGTALFVAVAHAALDVPTSLLRSFARSAITPVRNGAAIVWVAIALHLDVVPNLVLVFYRRAFAAGVRARADHHAADVAILLLAASFGVLAVQAVSFALVGIAPAVIAAERPGPLMALHRAFTLLSGARGPLFATWLILLCADTAVFLVTHAIGTAMPALVTYRIVALVDGVGGLMSAVTLAVYYRELTRLREGWRQPDLAETFD